MKRCAEVGMNKDAVQHERGPRNSTLRRQMSLYFKEQQHHQLNLSQPLMGQSDSVSPPPSLSVLNGRHSSSTGSTPTTILPSRSISTRIPTSSVSPPSKEALDVKQSSASSAFHHHLSMLAANEAAVAAVTNQRSLFMPSTVNIPSITPITGGFSTSFVPSTSPQVFPSSSPPASSSPLSGGTIVAPMPKYPHEVTPPSPPQPQVKPPMIPFSFPPPQQTFLPHPTMLNYSSVSPPIFPAFNAMALATAASLRHISSENLSETAARLLFMNVRWAQHVPAFTSLPYRDQLLLLEESWRELFILSAAQFSLPIEIAALQISSSATTSNPSNSPTIVSTLGDLKNCHEAIGKFQGMNVDATEFACLRAIILLKTCIESGGDDHKEVRDQAAISALQDQAQLTLSKYISSAYPSQPSRFGKLLLLLPSLKTVSSKSIEELFFKKTIGTIPIERIICDMYKSGAI